MRAFWIAVLALGCGGESGKVLGADGGGGEDASGGTNGASVGGSGGSNRPIGSAGRGGSAGKAGSAGNGSAGSAGAGERGEAGSPSMGVGGSAGEPAGTGGTLSDGGAAGEGEAGAGAEGGEPSGPQPELLWSYVLTASSQNPSLADLGDVGGTHRLALLLDGDPARVCVNLTWIVPEGDTEARVADQQELMALQNCLYASNAGEWTVTFRDPLAIIHDNYTVIAPAERSAWVLTDARLEVVENSWGEEDGTNIRAEWELWGYPR